MFKSGKRLNYLNYHLKYPSQSIQLNLEVDRMSKIKEITKMRKNEVKQGKEAKEGQKAQSKKTQSITDLD